MRKRSRGWIGERNTEKVLNGLSSQDRYRLSALIAKAILENYSYCCPSDCDRNLARINLCSRCRLEEQILAPMADALKEVE